MIDLVWFEVVLLVLRRMKIHRICPGLEWNPDRKLKLIRFPHFGILPYNTFPTVWDTHDQFLTTWASVLRGNVHRCCYLHKWKAEQTFFPRASLNQHPDMKRLQSASDNLLSVSSTCSRDGWTSHTYESDSLRQRWLRRFAAVFRAGCGEKKVKK